MANIIDNFDKTTSFSSSPFTSADNGEMSVTVFDGQKQPFTIFLNDYDKKIITFGRRSDNDVVLMSRIVSKNHFRLCQIGNSWKIEDTDSTNGLIYNNTLINSRTLSDGDFIRIDDNVQTITEGVLLIFSCHGSEEWHSFPVKGHNRITIGRSPECSIMLPHISVSKHHAEISCEDGLYYIRDTNSTNGVIINGSSITEKVCLNEKDIITITNSKLIFTSNSIFFASYRKGITVDAQDVVIERKSGRARFITCNHVSLDVRPGEMVAIIGGSGAGKSTILNAMCGYLPPTGGEVFINGNNLYRNFDALKKLIGYVPQQDIVYDNLTLYDMLNYTAKLRLPADISDAERNAAIERAIRTVELTEKKDSLIRALSGGQRKRASIAVELLSDPNLIFLDEPASGLDPGTERNLMHSLRIMADSGKTVILVTHSTLQLKLCDKIVFMGKGGKLCFYGSYDEALAFFGVSDIIDVYNMISDNADLWQKRYDAEKGAYGPVRESGTENKKNHENHIKQLGILCKRYLKLIVNDRQRLLLLILQAPLLAALISIVANGKQFVQFEMTKSLLFALSCSGFWIGMLNSIQEICKERTILKREYMTGLSLTMYLLSKILVLGLMCLLQSILIVGAFALLIGLPETNLILPPFLEMLVTTFLTALSSAAMGLFVSSLFDNADRAMTVAPILLLPQILFSGLIFKLEGAAEPVSWITSCRWSMEAYGSSANLNVLTLRLQEEGMPIKHEVESFYEYTASHLCSDWLLLLAFVVVFMLLARLVLIKISKETS